MDDDHKMKALLSCDMNREKSVYNFFSYLIKMERIAIEPLPWSYTSKVINRLFESQSLLDMGADGGEMLTLLNVLPERCCVLLNETDYIDEVKTRLDMAGIESTTKTEKKELPYKDNFFDTVISRHSPYDAEEVNRVLRPGGVFITEQVGSINDMTLNKYLEAPINPYALQWNKEIAGTELKQTGFRIEEEKEDFSKILFYDIGAVVYYLQKSPWQLENFDVDRYEHQLKLLHTKIMSTGYLESRSHRFFIEAVKS